MSLSVVNSEGHNQPAHLLEFTLFTFNLINTFYMASHAEYINTAKKNHQR